MKRQDLKGSIMGPVTLQLPGSTGGGPPSNVMGDHLAMLSGLVETLSQGFCNDSDDQSLSWTFIVLREIVRHLEEDLETCDQIYDQLRTPPKSANPKLKAVPQAKSTKKTAPKSKPSKRKAA